jgi:WD40 repeat protein
LVGTSRWAPLLWDLDTGALTGLGEHSGRVNAVTFSADGLYAATASSDKTARVWDLASKKALWIMRSHRERVRAVAFTPDGKRLLTAGDDRQARLWDLVSGAEINQLVGHTRGISGAALSPDGKLTVTTSEDGLVRLWTTDTCLGLDQIDLSSSGDFPTSVAFGQDARTLLIGTARGVVLHFTLNAISPTVL